MSTQAVGGLAPDHPYNQNGDRHIRHASYVAPLSRPGTVARDRLVKRLLAREADEHIVVVQAPAAYGKTTLMALWDQADPRPFAWAHLDALDSDATHLLHHLAAALDEHGLLSASCLRVLSSTGRPVEDEMVPTLTAELDRREPFVLVLDDVHLVTSPLASRCLKSIALAMPDGSTIALVGRAVDLPLAREGLLGNVLVLDTDDLTMSADEAARVVGATGVEVSDDALEALLRRTEGWPGGLHLAALALLDRNRSTDDPFFSDTDPLVAEFLVQEVLAALPIDTVTLLEHSSVLAQVSADRLDALLERHDSGLRLDQLLRSGNQFIIPAHDRSGFRFHGMFREVLRNRLQTSDPVLAAELERRASVLLEREGDVDGAIRHAVAAGDRRRALRLILLHTRELFFDGRGGLLRQWLELVGADGSCDEPEAAVAWLWCGLAEGDLEQVMKALNAAEQSGHEGPLSDGSPSIDVVISAARAVVGIDGLDGVLRDAETVRQGGPPHANPWWALATVAQASAYAMLGERDQARDLFLVGLTHLTDSPTLEAVALAHLALLDLQDGDLTEADRRASAAIRIAERHRLEATVPAIAAYAAGALVAARCNRRDEAAALSATSREMLGRLGFLSPRTCLFGYLLLAQAALALGDLAAARVLADEAARARRREPSAIGLNEQLDQLREQLDRPAVASTGGVALTAAEMRVLILLPTHMSLQEIAAQLMTSRNTTKSHSVAIYRKLGVSSRSDAVGEARRLGLIDAVPTVTSD